MSYEEQLLEAAEQCEIDAIFLPFDPTGIINVAFQKGAKWQHEYERVNPSAIRSLISFLSTPKAKRKGVTLTSDQCKEWVELLKDEKQW